MRKLSFILVVLFVFGISQLAWGQSVVVNEMSQGSAGNAEWVELVVINDNVDMRNWEMGDNDDGTWSSIVEFTNHTNWSSVARGTIIVIYNGGDIDGTITSAGGEDTDFSDKTVIIPHDNTTYFTDTGSWPGSACFANSDGDDCAAIRDASDIMVHDMAVTHGTATVPGPGTSSVKYFTEDSVSEIVNNANWTEATSTSGTPGAGNGGNNTSWIENVLPIELASFFAEITKDGIRLHWETASEIENAGFYIYKNGERISSLIPGAGTTTEPQQYAYFDDDVIAGELYTYQISDIEEDTQAETFHPTISVIAGKGMVNNDEPPAAYALHENYPNPFNPTTTLSFDLPEAASLQLAIYDAAGQLVKTFADGEVWDSGSYTLTWNGEDYQGKAVSSGTYYFKIVTENYKASQALILLK